MAKKQDAPQKDNAMVAARIERNKRLTAERLKREFNRKQMKLQRRALRKKPMRGAARAARRGNIQPMKEAL